MPARAEVRTKRVSKFYRPFPRQNEFHECLAKYRLFGGAAGPGKTKALLWEAILQAWEHDGVNTLLLRRTFPELEASLLTYFRRDVPLTPVWANEMYEYPYLQWQMEVHRARLKASYPHAADKIQIGGPQGADDVYARASRVAVAQGLPTVHPGDALFNLITFSRTWIRPWAFYAIEDKTVRDELLELFPDGCYAAFAAETYCESRNETMDDHWRVMHALPGDGQNRPSVGDSLVQVQERYNVLSNIQAETYEFPADLRRPAGARL